MEKLEKEAIAARINWHTALESVLGRTVSVEVEHNYSVWHGGMKYQDWYFDEDTTCGMEDKISCITFSRIREEWYNLDHDLREMEDSGMNEYCGGHVHVDVSGITRDTVTSLFALGIALDHVAWERLGINRYRREGEYGEKAMSFESYCSYMRKEYSVPGISSHYWGRRGDEYRGLASRLWLNVNPIGYDEIPHIEFRVFDPPRNVAEMTKNMMIACAMYEVCQQLPYETIIQCDPNALFDVCQDMADAAYNKMQFPNAAIYVAI